MNRESLYRPTPEKDTSVAMLAIAGEQACQSFGQMNGALSHAYPMDTGSRARLLPVRIADLWVNTFDRHRYCFQHQLCVSVLDGICV